jgi:hypothetical protein
MRAVRADKSVSLNGLHATIILLTLTTAAVHISRALVNPHIAVLFTLNACGYLGLLGLLYLPLPFLYRGRAAMRWVLIGYVVVTMALYVVWGVLKGEWLIPVGPADKVVEGLLIASLVLVARQERTETKA